MPRKLPWAKGGNTKTSTTRTQHRRLVATVGQASKRSRLDDSNSMSEHEELPVEERGERQGPSTSPPPEPPSESFMVEGLEHDDKYRMVEDEFLRVAHTFTAHLHAAEYKRQEKLVKSRNAQTIRSISRPVVGKMPDSAKRKIAAAKLAKKQWATLQDEVVEKDGAAALSDDTDDDDCLPYIGTTLHGLMDSPRRTIASLHKLGHPASITRSAAEFRKPTVQLMAENLNSVSSDPRATFQARYTAKFDSAASTVSSDDDDDLDISIPALKPVKPEPKPAPDSDQVPEPSTKASSILSVKPTSSTSNDSEFSRAIYANSSGTPDPIATISRPTRLQRARRLKYGQDKEQEGKALDIIPSFF